MKISPKDTSSRFEEIRQTLEDGTEYWFAKELMPLLGYQNYWENFKKVIHRAEQACESSNMDIQEHFRDVTKQLTKTNQFGNYNTYDKDIMLTRYACYLVALNGDPRKQEVGTAQTYFASQTYKQEIFDKLTKDGKRLYVRDKVNEQNKKLMDTANKAGVKRFGTFQDAGYRGLYGLTAKEIAEKKKLGKDKILDRAGELELAANLFRITQTNEQLSQQLEANTNIGESSATQTHFIVGGKVRKAIKDIGGTMPEELPTQENIKEVQRRFEENKRKLGYTTNEQPLKIHSPEGFERAIEVIIEEEPVQSITHVKIKLRTDLTKEELDSLKQVIRSHEGNVELDFEIPYGSGYKTVKYKEGISYSKDFEQILSKYGDVNSS